MTKNKLLRIDNVGIVVKDLKAAIAFFVELGMELEGETTVEGEWVDRVIGLDDAKSDIAMLRTPDGGCMLELSSFQKPLTADTETDMSVNAQGKHRIMFAVTDIDDVVTRLQKLGAEVVDEVVQYGDVYRLCYMRGPEGIIIALAEQLN
jgi:catechol 2,3-dioxygenase-like lactoylglutathione lyase family enzyme